MWLLVAGMIKYIFLFYLGYFPLFPPRTSAISLSEIYIRSNGSLDLIKGSGRRFFVRVGNLTRFEVPKSLLEDLNIMSSVKQLSDQEVLSIPLKDDIVEDDRQPPGWLSIYKSLRKYPRMDPYVAQRLWRSDSLPDSYDGDNCELRHEPDGQVLKKIELHSELDYLYKVRIFCGTYTSIKSDILLNASADATRNLMAIRETWAKRCDGWIAFSAGVNDSSIPLIQLPVYLGESYANMWQKVRSIWSYVRFNYGNDFDYFLLGGDDLYYIIENLRYYLSSFTDSQKHMGLFLGRRFLYSKNPEKWFNSGGSGYILNRKSLNILVDNIEANPSICFPTRVYSGEDMGVTECLSRNGIFPFDTRDSLNEERFHPFDPGWNFLYHETYNGPLQNIGDASAYRDGSPNLKYHIECCSKDSVSFHYVKADAMRSIHSYVYMCSARNQHKNLLGVEHFHKVCKTWNTYYNGKIPNELKQKWDHYQCMVHDKASHHKHSSHHKKITRNTLSLNDLLNEYNSSLDIIKGDK